MICTNCKHLLEEDAHFCKNCGTEVLLLETLTEPYTAKYPLDYREALTLGAQVRAHFFKELEQVVAAEFGENEYRKYFDQFYKSDFYKSFDVRTQQLAEEAYSIHSGPSKQVSQQVDELLERNFFGFIDHFLVLHCEGLHELKIPEAILKYANATKESVNLREMILDYMSFDDEPDKVYTDLITIPPLKVKNAIQSFLFTQSKEKIFFICDQTVFGSCREGFAMTEQALHWKSHFNPAHSVFFDDLGEIKKEAEWISVNGLFFNVNKSMNYKMMKLLKKLRTLYSD